jgi:hypothetical protein
LPLRVGAKQKMCSGPSWRTSAPSLRAVVLVRPALSMRVRKLASVVWLEPIANFRGGSVAPSAIVACGNRCKVAPLPSIARRASQGRGVAVLCDRVQRGYPALLDITDGGPVGALVLARNAVAGDVWEREGRAAVAETIVLGPNRTRIFPSPSPMPSVGSRRHHRQTLLFGEIGQALLAQLRIGIVGLGGAGSVICQALAHLGVQALVLVDDDLVDETNLPRIVGSVPTDVGHAKVLVAKRLAGCVRPDILVETFKTNVTDPRAAQALAGCDAIFLAADSMQARHVVNAICMQYLIPGFQVGAKVTSDSGGSISDAFAVSRVIGSSGICMWCHELILRDQLALEALTPDERRRARYVDEVPAPAVITMNMTAASLALNDFLFSFVGLHDVEGLEPRWYHFLTREPVVEGRLRTPSTCAECAGRKAFGGRRALPVATTDGSLGAPWKGE